MDLESLTGICHGLEDHRREGLTRFLNELVEDYRLNLITSLISQAMPIFETQGNTREELLAGFANYIETETEWQEAVLHIEEALEAIRKAKSLEGEGQ